MADPHSLYIVTAIVVLGLMVWVGIVLSRPAGPPPPPPEKPLSSPSAATGDDDTQSPP